MRKPVFATLVLALCLSILPAASAGVSGKAVQETAEFLMKKFGKEVAGEGAEKLSGRIASAAARHGDDVLSAVRKVGPSARAWPTRRGSTPRNFCRLVTHYGDDAVRVFGRPKAMALFARYGDGAAEALIKHQGDRRGRSSRAWANLPSRRSARSESGAAGGWP